MITRANSVQLLDYRSFEALDDVTALRDNSRPRHVQTSSNLVSEVLLRWARQLLDCINVAFTNCSRNRPNDCGGALHQSVTIRLPVVNVVHDLMLKVARQLFQTLDPFVPWQLKPVVSRLIAGHRHCRC